MQFPNPWLSDILKPLSDAIFLSPNDRYVLLFALLASSCICWSSWKIRSREPRKDKVFINQTAWNKRNNRLLENNNPQSSNRNFERKWEKRLQPSDFHFHQVYTLTYLCNWKKNSSKKVRASKLNWRISSIVWISDYFNIVSKDGCIVNRT